MTTAQIVILVLLLYAGAMFLISRLAARRSRSFRAVISASGEGTTLMLVGGFVAGQIGSGFVVGGAEYGALYGIGGAWYGVACAGSALVAAALSRFIYDRRYLSLSDYFALRYGGRSMRLIYSIATIFGGISLLSGQLLAAKSVLATLGLPVELGVAAAALIGLAYSNITGMWGTMKISAIQSAVIFGGMLAALAIMLGTFGAGLLRISLPGECFQPIPFSGELLVSITAPMLMSSAVSQFGFQAVASSKSAETARNGFLIAAVILVPIALIPPVLGMYGRVLFPQLPAGHVFTALLLERMPVFVSAVILAAILVSVLISCSGAYLAVAANFVHDIYRGMIAPQANDRTCQKIMLAADGAICVAGILLALCMNDIIQLLSAGYSLIAAGCLVPFIGGILWKGGTERGALSAACVGMGASLADLLGIITLPYASISCVLLSAVAYVAGSLWVRR